MTEVENNLVEASPSERWELVPVWSIWVTERQRPLVPEHVAEVRDSFGRMGGQILLQPILLREDATGELTLVDGLHRLTAAREAGWTHIPAVIRRELSASEAQTLEAEANFVRLELTPLQRHEAWVTIYKPAHDARVSDRDENDVTQKFGNNVDLEPADGATPAETRITQKFGKDLGHESIRDAAKDATGLSIATLDRIGRVREIAEDETLPEAVREFAAAGVAKLDKPGAKVTPIFNEVEHAAAIQREVEDPETLALREAEATLDKTVRDSTLLAGRLTATEYASTLATAAQSDYLAREELRGVRVALTQSLASIVAIECSLATSSHAELALIGQEILDLMRKTLGEKLAAGLPEAVPHVAS